MKAIQVVIISILAIILYQACSPNAKKLRLETDETETKEDKAIESILLQSALVLDTVIPNPGIKYKESRKINPGQPPVTLDFTGNPETKELDLSEYFSTARYLKIKYPYPDKGSFLNDAEISIYYERGMNSFRGYNSSLWLTPGNIVAGDPYMGYHCYDSTGNFLYTIAVMDKLPDYNKTSNTIEMQDDPAEKQIIDVSCYKNILLISTFANNKTQLSFFNPAANKTYLSRPEYRMRRGHKFMLSPDTYVDYLYSPLDTTNRPFLITFDVKGDTLCGFYNYNPKPLPKSSAYTQPEYATFYYYDDILTVRQAYNDTVYRVKSASELEPAYVLNFGQQKLDIQTALYGNKAGKLIPNIWSENKKFVLFVYTENYDCPNCRENKTVHFFYSFYDKQKKQLYRLPATDFYPEDYWINNSIDGAIPLTTEDIHTDSSGLYVSYTKAQIGKMLKHKNFSAIPAVQQTKMKELYDEMEDSELLIMILEYKL